MKIAITGNSGSGKTWLAKRLGVFYRIPVIHLDDLFWMPGGFGQKRSREELALLIEQTGETASWVVEGVFGKLIGEYLDDAELFIWLDIQWPICKSRLEKRGSESKRHMGRAESQEGLKELIQWASLYNDRQNPNSYSGHKALLNSFSGIKKHLRSETEVNDYLNRLMGGN